MFSDQNVNFDVGIPFLELLSDSSATVTHSFPDDDASFSC